MLRDLLRFLQLTIAVLVITVLTGCFEVRERLRIEPDESGTYTLMIGIDMSGMLDLAGPPGSEERKAAVANMADGPSEPLDAGDDLPEGITFAGGGTRMDGEKLVVEASFGFADLEALQKPTRVLDHMGSGDTGPLSSAKDGEPRPLLRVPMTRKGKKIHIQGELYDGPPDDLPETPAEGEEVPPEMAGMVEMMNSIQFVFEVETVKHKVKKHDADEVDGKVLRWKHGIQDLKKGATIDLTLQK